MLSKLSPLEVSRRLKAARHLHGKLDADGAFEALKVKELAQREPIASSRLTANWLEDLEQMNKEKIYTQDLDLITEALNLPEWWFDEVGPRNSEILRRLDRLEALIALKIPDAPPSDAQEDAPSGGRKLSRAEQQWRRATKKLAPDEQTGPPDPEVPSSE